MKSNSQLKKGATLSLPKGWDVKKLGEVCENLDRQRIPITKKNRIAGNIPYYGASGIVDYVEKYLFDEDLLCISEDGANLLVRKYPIVFSISGKTWVNNHAHILRFESMITQKFVELYINSITLDDFISGMAQPKLNQTKLNSIPIPLPPLPEQQHIVAILDKAFAAIVTAKANVQQNLLNAKELFESYLQNIFDPSTRSGQEGDDWEEKKLGEVCIVERGSSPRPIKKYLTEDEDGVNWIKIGDTKNIEKYIYKTKQKITKEGAKKSRFVEEGDFILSNSMSFGKPYIVKTKGYIHDGWFKLKLHNFVDTEYFYQLLSSPYVNDQFHSLASGSVVKNISGDLVKKVILPIPPLKQQQQIVKKLNNLSTETKKLESIYQQKIVNLEELKKSILNKAFKGEL